MSLFKTKSVAAPSPDPSATSSAAVPSSTPTAAAASWPSQGCVTDSYDRSLKGYSEWTDAGWTAASCTALCSSKGFSVAGIEVKTQCYCSNQIDAAGVRVVDDGECDWTCDGTSDRCGGGWRLSIYSDKSLAAIVGGNDSPASTSSASSAAAEATSASVSADPTPASTAASSPTTAPSSGGSKAVYAHMMVGNTYPFNYDSWMSNIRLASAAGFDGFALNVGHEDWQAQQVRTAYQAAADSGTGFKMFLSLDMTSLACSAGWHADALKAYVTDYAGHSAQAYYSGRQLVSTFAGTDCSYGYGDRNAGWEGAFKQPLKAGGNDIFFIPSIFTDPSTFGASALDGELNWNSGWPSGGGDLDFSSDERYMSALGSKAYMAAVSPAFYTHYGALVAFAPALPSLGH
jgi:glucan endo-1,3-alpha-glucosidase